MKPFEKVQEIAIETPEAIVKGYLQIPREAKAIIVFAHGSGSGRNSSRNQHVASMFQAQHLATLLIDLLTPEEEVIDNQTRELRFNISFLAKRLNAVTEWLLQHPSTKHLAVGYIGSSTGAAAALVAAADSPETIRAVVSRGGRPDLAGAALLRVKAPTLLIVGGNDFDVLRLNQEALRLLNVEKKLDVIPHATHLFEEPGTLQKASESACSWFLKWLDHL